MSLNIANIDKLLAFMRALPAEHFSMQTSDRPSCDTPGCIWELGFSHDEHGCIAGLAKAIGLDDWQALFTPIGWMGCNETGDFPLARAIDVVQHLRDTGEVDWDRFPPENYRTPAAPKPAWSPPVAIEIAPELPESLTRFVREPVGAEG